MIIPRERKLVRMYVQVSSSLAEKYRASHRDPDVIMEAVRKVMQPYHFDASRVEWSTIYSVSEKTPIVKKDYRTVNKLPDCRLATGTAENCLDMTESSLLATLSTPILPKLARE